VAPGRYSRRRTRFRLTFSPPVPTRSLQEVTVMCTRGPSTVQGFALSVCGCMLRMVHRKLPRCASDADRLRLVGMPPVMFVPRLPPLPVIRHRQGPLLPPFLQCDSWGPQGVRYRSQSRSTITPTLTQPNILVDDSCHAHITGFVLATVIGDGDSVKSGSCQHGHTRRWSAPEILNGEGTCNKEADIFSFAMVRSRCAMGDLPCIELWLIIASCRCRCSLVRFCSIMDRPPWLFRP